MRRIMRLGVAVFAWFVVVAPAALAQPPSACTIGWLTCVPWGCPFSGWPPAPLAIIHVICCAGSTCWIQSGVVGCC